MTDQAASSADGETLANSRHASRLPNFFILGAPKCGTTSLHGYLSQHPEIFMTKEKDPRYFHHDRDYEPGIANYIKTHFFHAEGYRVRGETSPVYLRFPDVVAPRLKKELPSDDLKFTILLRDPVARAWSHYLHRRRLTLETESFERALELEEDRVRADPYEWFGYFRDGVYAGQIGRWFAHFPRESFRIYLTDDLAADTNDVLSDLCAFLGVSTDFRFDAVKRANPAGSSKLELVNQLLFWPNPLKAVIKAMLPQAVRKRLRAKVLRANRSDRVPEFDPQVRARLRAAYRENILELQDLIGRDLSDWLEAA